MDLSDPTLYIVLILLVVLSAVAYFEIKYLRRKRVERAEAKAKVDDIYNQIITARAVSNTIKGQGKNTKDADLALLDADTAFSRGNYTDAKAAVERAKGLLRDAKKEDLSIQPKPLAKKPSDEKIQEKCEVPFQATKKLPTNYVESKFMICSVKDQINAAGSSGTDVSVAKDSLKIAEEAFGREDYTVALKEALRAKRALESEQTSTERNSVGTQLPSIEKVPSAVVVKAKVSKCEKCSTDLDPDDTFCSKCGAKVERDIRCPRCGNKLKVEDAFCRKCGLPLRSD